MSAIPKAAPAANEDVCSDLLVVVAAKYGVEYDPEDVSFIAVSHDAETFYVREAPSRPYGVHVQNASDTAENADERAEALLVARCGLQRLRSDPEPTELKAANDNTAFEDSRAAAAEAVRTWQAANDNISPDDLTEHPYPLPPMHPDPWTPEAAGGLLGGVARWINSTAIIPVAELSVASSLALLAGMFGDKALGPTRSGLNVFVTTLMETAGGKGHPPKAMRLLADLSGKAGAVTNGDPTSYAAIERMLRKNKSTVVVLDEFGVTLQDVNARHTNSAAASIRKMCLAIYDQANSKFEGRAYASAETKKDDSPIDGPALTLLGMTTPQTLYAGLSEAAISDGFLNRFLFVEGSSPEAIKPPALYRDGSPPEALREGLRSAIIDFPKPEGNVAGLLGKIVIPFLGDESGDAYRSWSDVFMWEKANPWTDAERHINGRAAENTIRLASLRAVSREPSSPAVTADDVAWGFAIVHRSIGIISAGCARHMSSSPAEALRKAIVEALRAAKGYTLPFSQLLQRSGVRGADMRQIHDALRWLGDTGEVEDLARRPIPGRGSSLRLTTA